VVGLVLDVILLSAVSRGSVNWTDRCERLCARPWTWHDGLYLMLVMGTLLAAMILAAQIMSQGGILLSEPLERLLMLTQTIFMQGLALATIERLRRQRACSYTACFGANPHAIGRSLLHGMVFYLAIMPPVILAALASNFVLKFFNIPIDSQDILKGFADPTAPVWFRSCLITMAVVLAPLVEEVIFRGVALPLVARAASPAAAVVAVSLLFALVHGHLPALAPLFIVASGFSIAYIYSGCILVPMTMHALFNGFNLIIFYLSYDAMQL